MASYSLLLAPAAIQDLKTIKHYGTKNWGKKRALDYQEMIKEALWTLTQHPHVGRERDEISLSLRGLSVGKHMIYYRVGTRDIKIDRVLHQRQDVLT